MRRTHRKKWPSSNKLRHPRSKCRRFHRAQASWAEPIPNLSEPKHTLGRTHRKRSRAQTNWAEPTPNLIKPHHVGLNPPKNRPSQNQFGRTLPEFGGAQTHWVEAAPSLVEPQQSGPSQPKVGRAHMSLDDPGNMAELVPNVVGPTQVWQHPPQSWSNVAQV